MRFASVVALEAEVVLIVVCIERLLMRRDFIEHFCDFLFKRPHPFFFFLDQLPDIDLHVCSLPFGCKDLLLLQKMVVLDAKAVEFQLIL